MFSPQLKKGSMDLMVLATIEDRARHGYEIGKLIELRSGGRLEFRISSLYQVLHRLEQNGLVEGRWVEKPGERRRCYYKLTEEGQRALAGERERWREFAAAVELVAGISHA